MRHLRSRGSRALTAVLAGTFLLSGLAAGTASAQTRLTYKSASAGTAYYQMGVELSEAIKAGTEGEVTLTLEESQGSVQNVMEVMARPGNYVFTSPPGLVSKARESSGPFENRNHPRFQEIRALFPIPSLTMHFVVAGEQDTLSLDELAGKHLLIGQGSFGAREAARYLDLFELADQVEVDDADVGSAPDALKNGQIDAFATASSFPAPNVIETAASHDVGLVSFSEAEVEATGAAPQIIPAGTYAGVDEDVLTTSLPVVAYTTSAMDEETAYTLTKTFWERREAMAKTSPWWQAISPQMLANLEGPLHPGALRYYEESGVQIPDAQR
ncbi:TAXI family TRAP transporter solute-binding subunit [Halomonas denitrificans]|uniref:TAXI family TRAP transporter solute-binding subunit n=1 Tax=Halomonas TaxID=2745 RepID=UPI001A8BFA39|nr:MULTISPECIES: TAXI family TRAP transporter solute-binding subunit [Halomonas]MED5296553.1 TAXI family TRAP transporter solute-binding subunit [Pseudomonadota bacterium]MBN8412966.1 TAXI family TRAP transporter solute-binding subunit [Halomonas litopenaei]MBY5925282.1 TAXI family TRAP transporter solute-binding subunit [Halomonas sp. DP4Y7-2]MBY5929096.1 TAXI family TRAP transporter solute-binding subunit [Halomonas sp. DP8Y7-3]MBY5968189.1 TAXI family TRAP transporter solute-binding subunit